MSVKRPNDVPAGAVCQADGTWVLGNQKNGRREGSFRFYDAKGFEYLIASFEKGVATRGYRYHEAGAAKLDFVAKTGTFTRYNGETAIDFGEGIPRFPSEAAAKATFEVDVTDPANALYTTKNARFYDANGVELVGADGTPKKPRPNAVLVGSGADRYWREDNTLYRMDGTKVFVLGYAKKQLTQIDVFDEAGTLTLSQVLGAKPRLTIVSGKQRIEIAPSDTAGVSTPKAFVARFRKVYGRILKLPAVKVTVGNVLQIAHAKLETYDDIVRVTSLLGNGGGDEVVLVEEPGKYKGHVFWNLHDEGLASLDDIADHAGDQTKKDRFIKSLPFFQNPVATSLEELWTKIEVHPREDHAGHMKALAPIT